VSTQGNIVVKVNDRFTLIFTTSRWGGAETPKIVQDALRDATPRNGDVRWFLSALMHNDSVSHPIEMIGNADTPTVIVDLWAQTVTWQLDHNKVILATWTFETYMAERFDVRSPSNSIYIQHFTW
jgi:hypothetical protein